MPKPNQWKECTAEFAKQNPDTSRVRERLDDGHQWSWPNWCKVSHCELQDDGWYEFQTLETQN
jgi:hypothetical protein